MWLWLPKRRESKGWGVGRGKERAAISMMVSINHRKYWHSIIAFLPSTSSFLPFTILLGFSFWVVDPAVRTVSRRRLFLQVRHCLSGQNSERFPSLNTSDILILNYPETAPRISARYITSLYTSGERPHNRTISQNYYLRPVSWPLKHLCLSPGVIPVPVRAKLCHNEGMHPTKSSSPPAPKYSII
jgi:hypothetical protein